MSDTLDEDEYIAMVFPDRVMTLDEAEDFGRKASNGARAYGHGQKWSKAVIEDFAKRVRSRVEWKLHRIRRSQKST